MPQGVTGDAADPAFRTIAIVGVGLIGGSIGLAARATWPGVRVIGIDTRDVLVSALALGAVTDTAGDVSAAAGADLVVLCAPIAVNIQALTALAPRLAPGTLITDVGSTKRGIVAAAESHGLEGFVGGHPLAGAATSGTASAREQLFRGRPWILTPSSRSAGAAVERLRAFTRALGAAPTVLDAASHDRLIAYVSHLPQVVASTLLHTLGATVGETGLALSGPGLADTTRLAASPGPLWAGILAANADHVGEAITALQAALGSVRDGLGDAAAVESTFASAARWRRAIKLIGEADRPQSWRGAPPERTVPAVRTYLEQATRPQAATTWPDAGWRFVRVDSCPATFYRFLYREVGRPWHWIDRLPWPDDRIRAHVANPGIEIWLLTHETVPAGFVELERAPDGSVEIVYFGLLPDFIGRRVGRVFLEAVVGRAWAGGATRVWLHTCTLDHHRALATYVAGGFRVVREEAYTARLETVPAT
ncbi:MAG: prephenate dehydrogenase/arogenate dehydrogenase family protein [Vicinamibacteraceae bacterium]